MIFQRIASLVSAACLALALPHMSHAADPIYSPDATATPEAPQPAGEQYVMDLGGGAIVKPRYPGAEDYLVYPFPIVTVGRFFVPGLGQVVDEENKKRGFLIYPSFDFVGERKASDSSDLTGTNKIDWAFELGLGAAYRYDWIRGFVEVRQGFNGHTGQVAEFGVELIATPTERLEFVFGPRASWGSDNYMDTYFGVTPAESIASLGFLAPFNPNSGFKTVGLAARTSYDWTDDVTFHLQAGWERFIGDADNSPIVIAGSENQFWIGAGATYRFAFNLFGR